MTTITLPRATVEQALEALESVDWYLTQLEEIVYSADDAGTHEERAKAQPAITALRAALAQQPEPPPPLWPPTGLEPRGCPMPGACSCPSESMRSTHSEECWQWHQACAVAAVIRLRAEVARLSKRDGE